jgi:signal transduction histidine kinase
VDNCLIGDRLDAAAFRLQLDHVPVSELVDDAAQIAQWSPRHELRQDLSRAPAEWECDPMLVRIALSNLVDNAVKYAQPGRIGITAALGERGDLRLSVSDDGPGVTSDAVQRFFERGQRGNHRTPRGGTCFSLVLPAQVPAAARDGAAP